MRTLLTLLPISILAASTFAADEKKPEKPVVEAVFVLDSTGSMSGLIQGAKARIWDIANEIARQEPKPDIKMGIVTYRDKGDEYVTKTFPLTQDLDELWAGLITIKADGGGDEPESVNQALHEAVNNTQWSPKEKNAYRVIFLVGDCPPHMDYQEDVKYMKSCEIAGSKGILINTILCGSNRSAKEIWQDIAKRGEGDFAQILQSGGVQDIETPHDKQLAELSRRLNGTVIAYGSAAGQVKLGEKMKNAGALAPPQAAQRAMLNSGEGYTVQQVDGGLSNDLLQDVRNGADAFKILQNTPELPKEMMEMSMKDREAYVEAKKAERNKINAEIAELSKKRAEWLAAEKDKKPGKEKAFDTAVSETIKAQFKAKIKK